MGKIEEVEIKENILKIFSRLPYRMECKLEELIVKMAEGMEGKLSDFEDMDIKDMEMSDLKGFDISKKMAINDYLLINTILQPKLTEADLDNPDHELNEYFKEIGDYLFEKYMDQYSKKSQEKKKHIKSPV